MIFFPNTNNLNTILNFYEENKIAADEFPQLNIPFQNKLVTDN